MVLHPGIARAPAFFCYGNARRFRLQKRDMGRSYADSGVPRAGDIFTPFGKTSEMAGGGVLGMREIRRDHPPQTQSFCVTSSTTAVSTACSASLTIFFPSICLMRNIFLTKTLRNSKDDYPRRLICCFVDNRSNCPSSVNYLRGRPYNVSPGTQDHLSGRASGCSAGPPADASDHVSTGSCAAVSSDRNPFDRFNTADAGSTTA